MNLYDELDRCVMCGMCSQHCPTYALTADENESPRGRIALISALNNGQLGISDKLVAHLENCTNCRACEVYCPSAVRFGQIMDAAKTIIYKQRPQSFSQNKIQTLLAKPQQTQRLGRWLERYQRWGLQRLMRTTGLLSVTGLSNKDNLLPKQISNNSNRQTHPDYSPATGHSGLQNRGDVALFTGCISSIFDREALDASRYLLNRMGFGVYTPANQTCCGAMHRHSGESNKAIELAKTNLDAFNKLSIDAIVHTSTGCTSFLQEYSQLDSTFSFKSEIHDINDFLLKSDGLAALTFTSLPKQVAVHEPCSARNVMHVASSPYRLLEVIPELECVALPDNAMCCGAAGSQLMSPTKISLELRKRKVDALLKINRKPDNGSQDSPVIDTVVTTNIGCSLHLAAGFREQNSPVEVIHPLTLLARQVENIEFQSPKLASPRAGVVT